MTGERGSGQRYGLRGPSMFPLIRPMQAVVEPTRQWQAGDIAAYIGPTGDRLIFHRVLAISDDMLITRGDINLSEDQPVPLSAAIGRVVRIELAGYGVNLPETGRLATAQRRLGLAWGRVAPGLWKIGRRLRRTGKV